MRRFTFHAFHGVLQVHALNRAFGGWHCASCHLCRNRKWSPTWGAWIQLHQLDVHDEVFCVEWCLMPFGVDGRWTKLMFEKLWMLDDVTLVTWLVSFHFSIWTTNDNHEVVTFTAAISACHNVSEWLVGSGRHGDKASWNETRNQKGLGP